MCTWVIGHKAYIPGCLGRPGWTEGAWLEKGSWLQAVCCFIEEYLGTNVQPRRDFSFWWRDLYIWRLCTFLIRILVTDVSLAHLKNRIYQTESLSPAYRLWVSGPPLTCTGTANIHSTPRAPEYLPALFNLHDIHVPILQMRNQKTKKLSRIMGLANGRSR